MRASRRHDAPECDKHERAAPLFLRLAAAGLWAVGQYSLQFARELAAEGRDLILRQLGRSLMRGDPGPP